MTSNTFMALLNLELMRHRFQAATSHNKRMVTLTNHKGNSIYLAMSDEPLNSVEVSVYKISARCFNRIVDLNTYTTEDQAKLWIDEIINIIVFKLKLKPHEHA